MDCLERINENFTPSATPAADHPAPASREWLIFFALMLALTLASSVLFLSARHFSYRCHIDEPGKVRQIISGERNFNHPLLMLNAAQVATELSGVERTPQSVAEVGRGVIGVFSVLTVLFFAAAAYVSAGPVAALVCGLFLMTSPLVVEVSHYFKEDPALTMGLGLTMLGLALFDKSPTAGRLAVMATGAALAASGKHIGAMTIPFCLFAIARGRGGWRHYAGFFAVMLGVYAAVNYQAVSHALLCTQRLQREVSMINQGGIVEADNLAHFYPFKKYLGMLSGSLPLPLFWFIAFAVWIGVREKKWMPRGAAIFALVFFVMICSINKTAGRYFLPVIGMAAFLAGLGAAWIAARRGWGWRIVGFGIPLLMAAFIGLPRGWAASRAFRHDTRLEMARWIGSNLPQDALIAQDTLGHLETDPASGSPYCVPQPLFVTKENLRGVSVARLKKAGVRYILLVTPGGADSKQKWRKKQAQGDVDDALEAELGRLKRMRELKGARFANNVSPNVVLYRLPKE